MEMSEDTSDEERLNSLVMEARILESTFNELSARQNMLERALLENRAALEAIKGLTDQKPTETLLQIGAGVLVRASPPSVDRVLVSVGASVVIEKTREEATAYLEARAREVEQSVVSLLNQRNEIAERLESDRQTLQAMLGRQGQKS
jgi:prefoldin alpha subunit